MNFMFGAFINSVFHACPDCSQMILYIVIIVVQFVTIIILGLVVMRMRRSQGSKNSKMEVVDERHNAGFDGTASSEKDVSVENANAEEYSNYEELHRQEDKDEHTYQSLQTQTKNCWNIIFN